MRANRKALKATALAILFIAPYFALWFTFMILPIGYGFYISLHDWNPILGSTFIGFDNYTTLFSTARFWNAMAVTGIYSAWVIPLIMGFGLAFAVMLHRARVPGLGFVEGSLFFPYLLNVSVVSIVWLFILDPNVGIVPYYTRLVGIELPVMLNDPFWVVPTIALVTAWWLTGYRMVVFRAGLQSIPDEIYESAALDGAGRLRAFWSITLPLLKPALLFAAVLTLVGGMRTFGQVIIMTGGGPGTSSEVLALYMYRLAFEFLRFGQAAAVGFILFAIIFVLSLGMFRAMGFDSELR